MCRIGGQSGEDVGEPGLRVDVIQLSADDQAVENGSALSAAIGTAEQPGLSAESDAAQGLASALRNSARACTAV
jgi:hypothetical protein